MSNLARKLSLKESPELQNRACSQLTEVINKEAGIFLNEDKYYLIQTRLTQRLSKLNLHSLSEYASLVQKDAKERQIFVETMTTHKTEWFREMIHFQWLKDFILPKIEQKKMIHIWSAACSTGEEVYSIAFLLLKLGAHPQNFRILGTDISNNVLNKCKNLPSTSEFQVQRDLLRRRFNNPLDFDEKLNATMKESLQFRTFNLIKDPLISGLEFDVIFLRNVLIYFERENVNSVCKKLSQSLKNPGHLILGLSESLNNEVPELETKGNSIYHVRRGKR